MFNENCKNCKRCKKYINLYTGEVYCGHNILLVIKKIIGDIIKYPGARTFKIFHIRRFY